MKRIVRAGLVAVALGMTPGTIGAHLVLLHDPLTANEHSASGLPAAAPEATSRSGAPGPP